MAMNMKTPTKSIDKYIAAFPEEVQPVLEKMRSIIRATAPGAGETIKYGIPTFTLGGNLIHFGGYRKHIGLYPAPRGNDEFKDELARYQGGKGTVQFPLDKPLPVSLIKRIVKFRLKDLRQKADLKKRKQN
jgi:uncharacterized protein YdhG (YjbR/CyaY superfamily)